MKESFRRFATSLALTLLVACRPFSRTQANAQAQTKDPHGWIGTETVKTRYGSFEFENGYPTAEATDKLYEFRTFNRAVESYLHFVTLMSMFYMQKGLNDFGLDAANKFLIFERLDAQSLYLTPNTESVYGMQFLDLKRDGPTLAVWRHDVLGPRREIQTIILKTSESFFSPTNCEQA